MEIAGAFLGTTIAEYVGVVELACLCEFVLKLGMLAFSLQFCVTKQSEQ